MGRIMRRIGTGSATQRIELGGTTAGMVEELSITYTTNPNVSNVNTIKAYKKDKIGYITAEFIATGTTSDWVDFCSISGWGSSYGNAGVACVAQSSTFKMCSVLIRGDGRLSIYTPTTLSNDRFRFTVAIPLTV